MTEFVRDFDDRDCGSSRPLRDVHRVSDVIGVTMSEENRVRFDLIGCHGRLGIAGKERVDEKRHAVCFQLESGMSQIPDVHRPLPSALSDLTAASEP